MLIGVSDLRGMSLRATDGTIGALDDICFDDATWMVRYAVVDTGSWLPGRRVLIAPDVLGEPDLGINEIPVRLTQDQVRSSPDVDLAKPVSRQMEEQLYRHYGWAPYWGEGILPLDVPERRGPLGDTTESETANPPAAIGAGTVEEASAPHLRSADTVTHYYIHACDGDIGHVEEFLVDTDARAIRYMVADTRNWLPGRKVLISPQWIEDISWTEETVHLDLTQAQVRGSPEWNPNRNVERDYERSLFDYYGRAPYWD